MWSRHARHKPNDPRLEDPQRELRGQRSTLDKGSHALNVSRQARTSEDHVTEHLNSMGKRVWPSARGAGDDLVLAWLEDTSFRGTNDGSSRSKNIIDSIHPRALVIGDKGRDRVFKRRKHQTSQTRSRSTPEEQLREDQRGGLEDRLQGAPRTRNEAFVPNGLEFSSEIGRRHTDADGKDSSGSVGSSIEGREAEYYPGSASQPGTTRLRGQKGKKHADNRHDSRSEFRQHGKRRRELKCRTKRSRKGKRRNTLPIIDVVQHFDTEAVLHDRITVSL
jgi:hypothetical protein